MVRIKTRKGLRRPQKQLPKTPSYYRGRVEGVQHVCSLISQVLSGHGSPEEGLIRVLNYAKEDIEKCEDSVKQMIKRGLAPDEKPNTFMQWIRNILKA